jgi:hypothetical protein
MKRSKYVFDRQFDAGRQRHYIFVISRNQGTPLRRGIGQKIIICKNRWVRRLSDTVIPLFSLSISLCLKKIIVISSKNKGYDEGKSTTERNFFTKIEKKSILPKKVSRVGNSFDFLSGCVG